MRKRILSVILVIGLIGIVACGTVEQQEVKNENANLSSSVSTTDPIYDVNTDLHSEDYNKEIDMQWNLYIDYEDNKIDNTISLVSYGEIPATFNIPEDLREKYNIYSRTNDLTKDKYYGLIMNYDDKQFEMRLGYDGDAFTDELHNLSYIRENTPAIIFNQKYAERVNYEVKTSKNLTVFKYEIKDKSANKDYNEFRYYIIPSINYINLNTTEVGRAIGFSLLLDCYYDIPIDEFMDFDKIVKFNINNNLYKEITDTEFNDAIDEVF